MPDELRDQARKIDTGGGDYIEAGDKVILIQGREYRLPGPETVTAHLQAILDNDNYNRWSDDRYVGGEALPMRVARFSQQPGGELERVDLLDAISEPQYCVIVGEPGLGKTTALERLMWVTAGKGGCVPVFVRLALYSPEERRDFPDIVRRGLNAEGVLNLDNDEALSLWLHDKEAHPDLWLLGPNQRKLSWRVKRFIFG
jgi:hypothetical protein